MMRHMISIAPQDATIAVEDDGVEFRTKDLGQHTVAFVKLAEGIDLGPALVGLPDDLCPCPHWGYMIKGAVRMHMIDGHRDFVAGEAFYWAPGHAPEALEDSEYVDVSPAAEFQHVLDHLTGAPART